MKFPPTSTPYAAALAVVVAICISAPGHAQVPSQDAAIGVWPWLVGNIDASTPGIIQQTQQNGLDTIYINLYRTTGPGTGTLHMTDESGTWTVALGSVSPDVTLTSFISQAHAAGLQVVGVVNCFLSGLASPGNAVHEAHLLDVIEYVVHTYTLSGDPYYDLDGLSLDHVRFHAGTGNPHQAVTAFVAQVKQTIGLLPLHAYLLSSLWYIDGPPYDGSFRSYSSAMGFLQTDFGQHWEDLAQYLDVSNPMAYVAEGGLYGTNTGLMQAYVQTVASHANQAAQAGGNPGQRNIPAIKFWSDSNGTTTAASVTACYSGALLGGADGVMAFRYFTAQGQTTWWNSLAALSQPGPDLPLANLSGLLVGGLTANVTASASGQNGGPFLYRYDLDADGLPDGAWSTSTAETLLLPQAGHLRVAAQVQDGAGRRAVARRQVSILADTLTAGPGFVSASAGGSMPLQLDFGPAASGFTFIIAGSLSGTWPGIPVSPAMTIPLNFDYFTDLSLLYANTPFFANTAGVVVPSGGASAGFWIPAGALPPTMAWNSLSFAAVGIAPGSASLGVASNGVTFTILP